MEEEKKEETVEETVEQKEETPVEEVKQEPPIEEPKVETPIVEEVKTESTKPTYESKKKNNWWKYVAIFLAIVIIILLLLKKCGKGDNYKITIHNGDEIIEVDKDFKLSDLDVKGGIVSFLVDSDGHIVDPSKKLDPKKEYSTHIIPEGKETVKVTYKNGSWSLTVKYQKGAGLLFPTDPTKEGYVFLGWMDEATNDYPIFMTPVTKDMVLVAQFAKPSIEGGKCKLNCDTNDDGKCDLNCDTDGDGKADKNIDLDGDGKCDLNCDADGDGKCDYKCDTDGDGVCDLNCEDDNTITTIYPLTNRPFHCGSRGVIYAIYDSKEYVLISFLLNEEELKPFDKEIDDSGFVTESYDVKKYLGSGQTYNHRIIWYFIDPTGQKYYIIKEEEWFYEGNCNSKPNNNCADTNEDGKCDEDLVLIIDDYDIAVGCKVGVTHRQTKKGVLISSTINGEEVKPDETLDAPESKYKWPTWNLSKYSEIGEPIVLIVKGFDYNEKDEKYEYVYTSKISFTEKCTNPDEPSAPNPEPEPTPGVTYTCPNGYTLSGTKCTKTTTDTKDAKLVDYKCPAGFTYTSSDGRCHKTEVMGCPAGYDDGPNGCEKQVFADLQCGSPYHVCGDSCCEADGTITQRERPHCQPGYVLDNSGSRCYTWLYDAQRGCYGENSTAIPGSFECDTVRNATPNYSCNAGYTLSGTKCTKTTTETIDATVN